MIWHFLDTGFGSGKFNMDFDINLAKTCPPENCYLRFYQWKPFCISLGANQKLSALNRSKIAEENIDVVIRPTGGRAIFHSEELTYSVIMPISENLSPRKIYEEINSALLKGLSNYDPALTFAELEKSQTHFPSFYKEELSSACFAVPAKNEIKIDGKKLAGSAQRKYGNVILQHGSILCGSMHKKIIDFMDLSDTQKSSFKFELDNKTADIKSILDCKVNYPLLKSSIQNGFEKHFKIEFKNYNHEAA